MPVRLPALLAGVLAGVLLLAGCAGRSGPLAVGDGPGRAAREGLEALVLRNDAAGAAPRLEAAAARHPGDPWTQLGLSLLARRALDGPAEVARLVALVAAAPDHPLALLALRRLGELSEGSPAQGELVERGVAGLAAAGSRLTGLAAFRGRVARLAAAEARGDLDLVLRLRAENGAVSAWTLAGPFGALSALDFDRPFPPEVGTLPAEAPAPLLGAPRPTRPLEAPDGVATLEGEPAEGEQFYLAADLTVARGGRYLVVIGAAASLRAWVDGAPLAERRAFEGPAPTQLVRPLELAAGRHLLLVKLARGGARTTLVVNLARVDGEPSDVTSAPRPPGPLAAAAPGPWPAPGFTPAELFGALRSGGLALAGLLAARDAQAGDLEAAKRLLEDALAAHPASAVLRAARGAAHAADGSLDEQIARGRAEAALRAALVADPGDGEVRLALADLVRRADRPADAAELLAGLPQPLTLRPAALAAQARVALDRGLAEEAEALAEAARGAGGSCDALKLLADQAGRREAAAREDELTSALLGCRGGRERRVRLLEQRGDAAGVLAALAPLLRARPTQLQAVLQRANALAALGDHAAAARSLEGPLATWPRGVGLLKAAADQLELAGDAVGARRLRQRSLVVDGSDLGLRRALALEDGHDVLDDVAQDGPAALRAYLATPRREAAGSSLVLDAAAIELHPGGALTERVHQVIRVLDQQAVDQQGELAAPSGAQVLALRALKADGRVFEPEGGAGKGTASLPGLEPGDFVELEYLRSVRGPHARQGVAADPFFFATPGASMVRSTYLVRAPPGLGMAADAHGLPPPQVVRQGDFEVVRAEATEVPALIPEPGAPPGPEHTPFVHVGVGGGREAVQLALADAAVPRTALTLELRALAAEVRALARAGTATSSATSPGEALVRAAAERVRALVVGQGGSFGEEASVVLSRGRGSRLVLLKALLDALGVRARFALARPLGGDRTDYRFPSPALWSAPVLRVELPGQVLWLDLALRQQPFGLLSEWAQGAEALLLPAPGEPAEVVRTPVQDGRPEGRELDLTVTLDADGGAEVRGVDRHHGTQGAAAKAGFERLDESARRQGLEALVSRAFRGLALTEQAIEGEDDPEAPFTLRWRGAVATLARQGPGGLEFDAPILQLRLGARHVQLATRTTPLLLATTERATLRLTVVPPPGVRPVAGLPQRLETPFGSYARTERVEAGALVREERLLLPRGRIAPADYPAFAAFCAAVDALQARPVTLPR
ncbi:MAG: hypothetical protein IPQ24_04555 [Anaeromyxobacter sp.]|nr:hypothetical protein [Anaeromyxobacter sp.]